MDENEKVEKVEAEVVEHPLGDMSMISVSDDPERRLAVMNKMAELAPMFKKARDAIVVAMTYPEDWEQFGEGDKAKMCLGSAGAERIGTMFNWQNKNVTFSKEEFVIEGKPYYRYVYEGLAVQGEKEIFTIGMYSTRDKFLGFANGEWVDTGDVNENSIRIAAYHIFTGNCVKALQGIRNMPKREWEEIMGKTGGDADKAGGHTYGGGTKGGTSGGDVELQQRLKEACLVVINCGMYAERDGKEFKLKLLEREPKNPADTLIFADDLSITLSSFVGNKGEVTGKKPEHLKGKWLANTLKTAERLAKEAEKAAEEQF